MMTFIKKLWLTKEGGSKEKGEHNSRRMITKEVAKA